MEPERFRVNQPPETTETQPEANKLPADPLSTLPPAPPSHYGSKSKPSKSKWWAWLILAAVAILVIAAWAYETHKPKPTAKSANVAAKTLTSPKQTKTTTQTAPSIPTSSHTTDSFGLTFSYPSSWSVVDSGNAGVTVTSPVQNLTAANGQVVLGQVVMTVANQGAVPTAFTSSSVAVLESQIVKYTSPTTNQAADTYLTFVQYPSTDTKGGLDGIYVTGNYGYQKDQSIPSSDLSTVDPLVYFTFYACSSSSCPIGSRQPLTIASADWNNSSFSAPVLITLKSFSFD